MHIVKWYIKSLYRNDIIWPPERTYCSIM